VAKFTASVPLNLEWFGYQIVGAAGATHRIDDALADEWAAGPGAHIPGFAWVLQDETTDFTSSAALALKYDKTGGTISGAVTITGALVAQNAVTVAGALVAQAGTSVKTLNGPIIFADQYSSIQAAHDALPATGGTIVIPPGTYVSSTTTPLLTITKNGVRIIGAGRFNTVLQLAASHSSSGAQVIKGTDGCNDLYIGHLTIDGNDASNGAGFSDADTPCGISIIATNTVRVTIEDVYVHNVWGSETVESFGIHIGNTEGVIISGCYVRECGGTGISLSGCTDFAISDCISVLNGTMGFSISTAQATPSRLGTVSNCVARGNANGFNFENCSRMGLSALAAYGNSFYGFVFHVSGGDPTTFAHDISGSGIMAASNGTSSAGAYAGILLSGNTTQGANGICLDGVRAYDDQAVKTQGYGVVSLAGSSANSIAGDLRGNLTGEASLALGTNNQYRPSRFIGASVTLSANVSLNSSSTTLIPWTTETNDVDAFHTSGAATRMTVPAGLAGKYRVSVNGIFANNATGFRLLRVLKNGTEITRAGGGASSAAGDVALSTSWVGDLAAADYIEVDAYQDSGGTLAFSTLSRLIIERA
jgi:hypothetical protein